jgi:hypothetical protein
MRTDSQTLLDSFFATLCAGAGGGEVGRAERQSTLFFDDAKTYRFNKNAWQ